MVPIPNRRTVDADLFTTKRRVGIFKFSYWFSWGADARAQSVENAYERQFFFVFVLCQTTGFLVKKKYEKEFATFFGCFYGSEHSIEEG